VAFGAVAVAVIVGGHNSEDSVARIASYHGTPTSAAGEVVYATEAGGDQPVAAAAWTTSGELAITTWGSGSCPYLVESLEVVGPQQLHAVIEPIPDRPCTMDLGPTTSVVRLPVGVNPDQPIRLDVRDAELLLPPR
jgi:hypothetical protein